MLVSFTSEDRHIPGAPRNMWRHRPMMRVCTLSVHMHTEHSQQNTCARTVGAHAEGSAMPKICIRVTAVPPS